MLQVARIVCFSGMATAMVWCLIWASNSLDWALCCSGYGVAK
jgi:hypothetical protein